MPGPHDARKRPDAALSVGRQTGRLATAAACALALGLVSCQRRPPQRPPEASITLPAPVEIGIEPAQWHFESTGARCVAYGLGRTVELIVTVRRNSVFFGFGLRGQMEGADEPGPPVTLRFTGSAGRWESAARLAPGPIAVAWLPLGGPSLGRISILLGGGQVEAIGNGNTLPTMELPPAGEAGRGWFNCAREKLL